MTPSTTPPEATSSAAPGGRRALAVVVWLWVGIPFAYGVWELVRTVTQLFSD